MGFRCYEVSQYGCFSGLVASLACRAFKLPSVADYRDFGEFAPRDLVGEALDVCTTLSDALRVRMNQTEIRDGPE